MQVRPDPADIVSTTQAAEILGVTVATVNRWAASGQLNVAFHGAGRTSPRFFWRADIEQRLADVQAERARATA